MNNHNFESLDLSPQGYQVDRVLGQNVHGGRVTYLARDLKAEIPVVVKQFQFAGNAWSNYDAYQREVDILQQLDHPRIPKYLTSWETPNGFCLVQEYKTGATLAKARRKFTLDAVKQITIDILEVLIYLQQQQPPVVHRDLKPENILIDEQNQVYVIDFGFARNNDQEVAASSTVKGTLGFMPPEQLFNRPLTKAADLYSLGVTLVCLLTGHKSTEIDQLIDNNYRLDLRSHLSHLPANFLAWLIKITDPNPDQRYSDAQTALTALQAVDRVVSNKPPSLVTIGLGVLFTMGLVTMYKPTTFIKTAISIAPLAPKAIEQIQADRGCPGCDLSGIDLHGKNLQSYDFTGANLTRADLRDADLRGASLRNADLTNAMWYGAILESTDLRGAKDPSGKVQP
jgi:serine/threonine protein kinase